MSFQFLVEVDRATPKYASRLIQNSDVVSIYPTRSEEIVLAGDHRDDVYKYFLRKCTELDCTQFYSTGLATGAVSLCQECEEFIPRGRGGGVGSGIPCQGYSRIENFGSLEDNQNLRVTNGSSAGEALSKAESYNTWKNSSTTNRLVANSGSWLGIDECVGGIWQCAVNCATGNTTACWSIEVELDEFGTIYTLNGAKYQIYDPLQIALAGVVPNGGTLPLVSSNPFFGLEINAQYPSLDDPENTFCGVTVTVFGGGGNDSNCLVGEPCPGCPNGYTPAPSTSDDVFPQEVALIGDYTSKTLTVGDNCYNLSGNSEAVSGVFGLGGTPNGVQPSTEEELGITDSSDYCGSCLGNLASNGGGADCCSLACGSIVINGAPEWNGSSWTPGSGSWNGFWPDFADDDFYRNIEDKDENDGGGKYYEPGTFEGDVTEEPRHIWHGAECGNKHNRANSLYSVPCSYSPPQPCSVGSNVVGVYEYLKSADLVDPSDFCDCNDGVYVNASCDCKETVDPITGEILKRCSPLSKNPGSDDICDITPSPGSDIATCPTSGGTKVPQFAIDCSGCQQPVDECSPPCNMIVTQFITSTASEFRQTVSIAKTAAAGKGCLKAPTTGVGDAIGCVSDVSITGIAISGWCTTNQNCASATTSGFIQDTKLKQLIDLGLGGGTTSSYGGTCCYETVSDPTNSSSKVECTQQVTESNWLSDRSEKCSRC